MNANSSNRARAFTRIECFALIIIIVLLSALAFPTAANNRGHTRTTLCLSNLKHLAFAWQLYATDHDGLLVGNFTAVDTISPPASLQVGQPVGWTGQLQHKTQTLTTSGTLDSHAFRTIFLLTRMFINALAIPFKVRSSVHAVGAAFAPSA